jgi:hypothetical protein
MGLNDYFNSPSFGADIEFFIKDKEGIIVNPSKLPKLTGKQVDGFAVEIHPHPSSCRETFCSNIRSSLQSLQVSIPIDMEVSLDQVSVIDKETWNKASAKTKEIGCLPDVNVYKMEVNTIPEHLKEIPYRTCGGHVHLGRPELLSTCNYTIPAAAYKDQSIFLKMLKEGKAQLSMGKTLTPPQYINIIKLIKLMDRFVGLWSVLADTSESVARREYYGKAGDFRFTKHGIEYRTLSNFWICHKLLAGAVSTLAKQAYGIAYQGGAWADKIIKALPDIDVQQVINKHDSSSAQTMIYELIDILGANSCGTVAALNTTNIAKYLKVASRFSEWKKQDFNRIAEGNFQATFNLMGNYKIAPTTKAKYNAVYATWKVFNKDKEIKNG